MNNIKELLDQKYWLYNQPTFEDTDPIQIPKSFSILQDIEIAAFWTAILSWGNRKTIINKAKELFDLMDNSPYQFIIHHKEVDLKRFEHFKHRTFQYTDTLYFISFLKRHYLVHQSLESAFLKDEKFVSIEESLNHFYQYFFDTEWVPNRTRKHIASPVKKATCKRLNMFLRWMVRKDKIGVDFGLWNHIPMSSLMIPLDVHVERIARQLGLLERKVLDWQAVIEISGKLKAFDHEDPIKYDYALFGMGVFETKQID